MANELTLFSGTTGLTDYCRIYNSTGQVWSTVASTFGTYSTASIANYTVAMTELGTASGIYQGTFPAGITTPGLYYVEVRTRAGGSVAESDAIDGIGEVEWSGTAIVPLSSRLAPTTANRTVTVDASGNVALSSSERDSIATALLDLADGVETSVTVRQSLRAIAAMLSGNVTGGNTSSELFKAIGNSGTTRVTNVGDDDGNRTITLNL